jgi:predicted Zn-dependent protease
LQSIALAVLKRISSSLSVLAASALLVTAPVQAAQKARSGPSMIRDAEIEGLLRSFSKPIFKAASINPNSVKVYVIQDDSINAFVAGGQRIFVNTGLFTKTKSPGEVIGVLAHETGHIAGGHLARLNSELERASTERIIGMLIGAAAMVGGAAAGSGEAAQAGQGILAGSQGLVQRNFLSYQRSMESAADQAALTFLASIKANPEGMLSLFQRMGNDSIAMTSGADPYQFSHPMPFERIRNLEEKVKLSPYFGQPEDAGQRLRYDLVKAKIIGYTQSPQRVYQRYPSSNKSMPARYARAVAMYKRGDLANAIPVIESLTDELPQNPYFWELKAQAYLEAAQPALGLEAISEAKRLLPNNGLIQILNAQLYLLKGSAKDADAAIKLLTLAQKTEGRSPGILKLQAQAYAIKGDTPRAELATAEFAWATGDRSLAVEKAKAAQKYFKKGTPEYTRASDLLTFAEKKK